jgi:hypothetical protein
MRRNYISSEYTKTNVYGTFNMLEESNFFSGKMLEIEDNVSIINEDIIWYQRLNGEQLDFTTESSLNSIVYSSSLSKQKNHKLILDEKQSDFQLNRNTKWILDIPLSTILSEYIFANLKRWRTFEGLKTDYTLEKDVNIAMLKYISSNVLTRYRFTKIELFIHYKDLRSDNLLKLKNTWNNNLNRNNLFNKIETITDFDEKNIKVLFEQQKSSSDFNFEYFFNVYFQKI